jgi:glycosyltransferase involved in cell wall biosynthesis
MGDSNSGFLRDVLVLTTRKGFWASRECGIFPNRIYTKVFYGYSQNLINASFLMLRGVFYHFIHKPKIIFVGSAPRIVPWLILLKKIGLLKNTKLAVTNQIYFNDRDARYLDKIISYSESEIMARDPQYRDRYIFMPLSADGQFESYQTDKTEDYIFSGGGQDRDFKSLIDAVRGLDTHLKIVTFSPETLDYPDRLPANCEVLWRMPVERFLELMSRSLFVVVPLKANNHVCGQTTVVQAMRLGKAVIATRHMGIDGYIRDGQEGFLVSAQDIAGYKKAIARLLTDSQLRRSFEQNARTRSLDFTYQAFSERLVRLCRELLSTDKGL